MGKIHNETEFVHIPEFKTVWKSFGFFNGFFDVCGSKYWMKVILKIINRNSISFCITIAWCADIHYNFDTMLQKMNHEQFQRDYNNHLLSWAFEVTRN